MILISLLVIFLVWDLVELVGQTVASRVLGKLHVFGFSYLLAPQVPVMAVEISMWWRKRYLYFILRRFGERPLSWKVLEEAFKLFVVLESLIALRSEVFFNFFNVYWIRWCQCIVIVKLCCVCKHPAFFCDYILLLTKITC